MRDLLHSVHDKQDDFLALQMATPTVLLLQLAAGWAGERVLPLHI